MLQIRQVKFPKDHKLGNSTITTTIESKSSGKEIACSMEDGTGATNSNDLQRQPNRVSHHVICGSIGLKVTIVSQCPQSSLSSPLFCPTFSKLLSLHSRNLFSLFLIRPMKKALDLLTNATNVYFNIRRGFMKEACHKN